MTDSPSGGFHRTRAIARYTPTVTTTDTTEATRFAEMIALIGVRPMTTSRSAGDAT